MSYLKSVDLVHFMEWLVDADTHVAPQDLLDQREQIAARYVAEHKKKVSRAMGSWRLRITLKQHRRSIDERSKSSRSGDEECQKRHCICRLTAKRMGCVQESIAC